MKVNFSCLDAVTAPFKDNVFDILFCKNLLHHLSKDEIKDFIKNALRISKILIIVEILDYKEQNEEGKKMHDEFYCGILKEARNKIYLTEKKISRIFNGYNITIEDTVSTNNGRYKYLWVQRN